MLFFLIQCEAVECKEEVADQIDDVAVCDNDKNENDELLPQQQQQPQHQPQQKQQQQQQKQQQQQQLPELTQEQQQPQQQQQSCGSDRNDKEGGVNCALSTGIGDAMENKGCTANENNPSQLRHPMNLLFESHGAVQTNNNNDNNNTNNINTNNNNDDNDLEYMPSDDIIEKRVLKVKWL